jgi:hypothetical protein
MGNSLKKYNRIKIVRAEKGDDDSYVAIDRRFLDTKVLSLDAIGILATLSSFPNQETTLKKLKETSSDAHESTVSLLKELQDLGYILSEYSDNDNEHIIKINSGKLK